MAWIEKDLVNFKVFKRIEQVDEDGDTFFEYLDSGKFIKGSMQAALSNMSSFHANRNLDNRFSYGLINRKIYYLYTDLNDFVEEEYILEDSRKKYKVKNISIWPSYIRYLIEEVIE